jgi:hypothetical protein
MRASVTTIIIMVAASSRVPSMDQRTTIMILSLATLADMFVNAPSAPNVHRH